MTEEFIEDIIAQSDTEAGKEIVSEMAKIASEDVSTDKTVTTDKDVSTDKIDDKTVSTDVDTDKPADVLENQKSIEELAEKLGWNKEHTGADKVDAATYILRSREIQDTMRDHNKDLKNQVTALHESIKAIQEHNEKVYKAEVKKLEADLAQLKKAKREAVELADVEKVDQLDAQIEEIQKDLSQPKEKNTDVSTGIENPVYDEWVKDNQWYETDDEMAGYADNIAAQYKGAPAARIYAIVTQKVKEVFPDKFETVQPVVDKTVKKENPIGPKSPVESASKRENSSTFTVNDLTAEQRNIMNQFVRQGIMTEKQYVEDIAKLQEV